MRALEHHMGEGPLLHVGEIGIDAVDLDTVLRVPLERARKVVLDLRGGKREGLRAGRRHRGALAGQDEHGTVADCALLGDGDRALASRGIARCGELGGGGVLRNGEAGGLVILGICREQLGEDHRGIGCLGVEVAQAPLEHDG